jgi:hypothetical protein
LERRMQDVIKRNDWNNPHASVVEPICSQWCRLFANRQDIV